MADFLNAIADPGTVIVAVVGLFGTFFAGWYQARVARDQIQKSHESQILLLRESQRREDQVRERQFAESDRADRLLILEYIDQLLPRLSDITSIYFLSGTVANQDDQERAAFNRLKSFMQATNVDPAHPERTLSIRLSFLLFQLIAAMRLGLNARWTRPLSTEQARFLAHYEDHLEPIFCSGRYPGDELLYREQIEMIADEMAIPKQQGIIRPLNWKEFCDLYQSGGVLRILADLVATRLRFVFDDANPKTTPLRRAMQCRLAILALYLIQMSEEAGNAGWSRREESIWTVVANWFSWQTQQNQHPQWYVFKRGDVAARFSEPPETPRIASA